MWVSPHQPRSLALCRLPAEQDVKLSGKAPVPRLPATMMIMD